MDRNRISNLIYMGMTFSSHLGVFLVCAYGGLIQPFKSGQEEEAEENQEE